MRSLLIVKHMLNNKDFWIFQGQSQFIGVRTKIYTYVVDFVLSPKEKEKEKEKEKLIF